MDTHLPLSPQDREVRDTYLSLSCKLNARILHVTANQKYPWIHQTPGTHWGELQTTHTTTLDNVLKYRYIPKYNYRQFP